MSYIINNYRVKKFGDKYFLTTDHGSYMVLSEKEVRSLKQNNLDYELKKKLEEREIILDETNLEEAVRLIRKRNQFLFTGTSLHILIPTLRCNMSCVYCHASSKNEDAKGKDMDKKTAKKVVDFIFQTPSNNITLEFQGGEPLLNWETIKYIISYAKKKNEDAKKTMNFALVTNLSMMNKEKMKYLIDNEVNVCTSLDGPKELHDYNRNFVGGSNYETGVKWIKEFKLEYEKRKIKNKRIDALVTITKRSLSYPKEIVDEYVKLGIEDIHLRFLHNLGVAKKTWPKIGYSAEEFLVFWKKAVGYIKKLNDKGIKLNERIISLIMNKINNDIDPNYLDLRTPCGASIGQLAYNYNGDIYTCDEARMLEEDDIFLLGNVKKEDYKNIVTCDKACAVTNASINNQYMCDSCVYKPFCGLCPVVNYAEQGTIIGKIAQTNRCKILMEQFNWVVKEKFIKENTP